MEHIYPKVLHSTTEMEHKSFHPNLVYKNRRRGRMCASGVAEVEGVDMKAQFFFMLSSENTL